jgi:hypothetical protein
MSKFIVTLASSRGDERCGTAPTRAAAFELAHRVIDDAARREARHHWFRGETIAVRIEGDDG